MSRLQWDEVIDVLVAGSGAGGMVSAIAAADLGLSVLVVEKAGKFGGSTAMSGGGVWIPNNPTLRKLGRTDDPESVRTYLHAVVGERVPAARIDAYVDRGPEVMEMLHRVSRHMAFTWCPGYSDYHPELPGGSAAGRTIEPKPIDSRILGDDEPDLLHFDVPAPFGVWFSGYEAKKLMMFRRTWAGRRMLPVAAWRVASNWVRKRRMKTIGAALIARLFLTLKDLGVPLWLQAPVVELVEENGMVLGAVVEREGRRVRVRARCGVVLATGGFEHDPVLRSQHLPALGQPDRSSGAYTNTGDGHRLGEAIGTAFDLMDDAWWMPSIALPRGGVFPLVSERCIPPMVIVNAQGERFTNEAGPYVNFVHAQLAGGHVPAYEVFGAKARARYQFTGVLPGAKFPGSFYKSGLVTEADSLDELADKLGMPPGSLTRTVARFDELVRKGHDDDFGRGDSAYDHYYGDPNLPNPTMDEVGPGPYYAVRIEAGDLGTKGGIVTDEHGRALRPDGSVIHGLYATGNVSASVMGNEYAGAGATIGPAMVFGYLAVHHAAKNLVPT